MHTTIAMPAFSTSRVSHADFGEMLFDMRTRCGLSQRQLAAATGMAHTSVSQVENCRRAPPDESTVARLAQVLELNASERKEFEYLAKQGRTHLGLRINRQTPQAIAQLIRDIAMRGRQLTPKQIDAIRRSLEMTMP